MPEKKQGSRQSAVPIHPTLWGLVAALAVVFQAGVARAEGFDTCESFEVNARGKWVHESKAAFTTVRDVKKLLVKKGIKQ